MTLTALLLQWPVVTHTSLGTSLLTASYVDQTFLSVFGQHRIHDSVLRRDPNILPRSRQSSSVQMPRSSHATTPSLGGLEQCLVSWVILCRPIVGGDSSSAVLERTHCPTVHLMTNITTISVLLWTALSADPPIHISLDEWGWAI